jgi:hypothetical protein
MQRAFLVIVVECSIFILSLGSLFSYLPVTYLLYQNRIAEITEGADPMRSNVTAALKESAIPMKKLRVL